MNLIAHCKNVFVSVTHYPGSTRYGMFTWRLPPLFALSRWEFIPRG